MTTYRTIAEAYDRALVFGIVGAAEVMAWTDNVIMAEPHPAYAFIEASCSRGDLEKLQCALRDVPGVADPDARRRMIFGWMRRALERGDVCVDRVVSLLFSMAVEDDLPDANCKDVIYQLDYGLDLGECGIPGTREEVKRELEQFLIQYGT